MQRSYVIVDVRLQAANSEGVPELARAKKKKKKPSSPLEFFKKEDNRAFLLSLLPLHFLKDNRVCLRKRGAGGRQGKELRCKRTKLVRYMKC